jgi:glucose-6-phosphate isomerase
LFETVITIEKDTEEIILEKESNDLDGLNYLAGKSLSFINSCAQKGTVIAHIDGGVPNLAIQLGARDEATLGELFYFFEFACGVSGYVLGVNPFDQEGVESYKKNMFALLGKKGYEARKKELAKKI